MDISNASTSISSIQKLDQMHGPGLIWTCQLLHVKHLSLLAPGRRSWRRQKQQKSRHGVRIGNVSREGQHISVEMQAGSKRKHSLAFFQHDKHLLQQVVGITFVLSLA